VTIRFPVFESISVTGFSLYPGKDGHGGMDVHFQPDENLVLGVNGLGKSTLLILLKQMIAGPTRLRAPGFIGKGQGEVLGGDPSMFAVRATGSTQDARAKLRVRFGDTTAIIERRLRDLAIVSFAVSEGAGEETQKDIATYQSTTAALAGVDTFPNLLRVLERSVFFLENRERLIWDWKAQYELFRATMMEADDARRLLDLEREIISSDSAARNLRAALYRLERRHQKDLKAFAKADDVHAALNAIQIRIDAAEARETTLVEEFDTASEHLADTRALVWTEDSKADSEASRYDHLKYLAVRHALGNVSNDISYVLLGLMRDGHCEVCGGDGLTELAAELSARQLEHRCLMCGSPRGDENVFTTSAALAQQAETAFEELERQREVAAEAKSRFDEASKRVEAIRSALDEVRREVDGFKRHRRVLRTQLPPEDRTALARAESEIDRLRLGAEGFEQDREIAERQVDELLEQLRNAVIGFRERIQEIFDRRAKDFFIERVRLVYVPRTEKIAQHRDALKFQFPAFEVDLTSGVSGSAFVRRTYEQASLSQREYLDIAFRMAFMEALGAETCSIVIDGPEGSVDVVFADRAGIMLSQYAAADGGPRNRQIIVACNVVEGGFIPHYFLDHPAALDRDSRTVNLLDIAHPTAALEALRPDYEAKVNAVLYRVTP
jgi:hypothetical protein